MTFSASSTINSTRIYTPQSGSRVFARGTGIGVADTNFGSHVVAHLGPVIKALAARQGERWRMEGRQALASLVEILGGIAWDEQGVLHYAASSLSAATAAALTLARVAKGEAREDLLLQASLAGGALYSSASPGSILQSMREAMDAFPASEEEEALQALASSSARAWDTSREARLVVEREEEEARRQTPLLPTTLGRILEHLRVLGACEGGGWRLPVGRSRTCPWPYPWRHAISSPRISHGSSGYQKSSGPGWPETGRNSWPTLRGRPAPRYGGVFLCTPT